MTTTGDAAIHLILPTYRRDEALRQMLAEIPQQTHRPATVYVIDNAGSPATDRLCQESAASMLPTVLHYVDAGENLGPAGSTALGMDLAMAHAGDTDWVMRADDDSIFPSPQTFEVLLEVGERLQQTDPRVGGVGLGGALWDSKRFRLVKPARGEEGSVVPVDYLATNHFAMFAVSAIKECGTFRGDLFFGHTEVEYGLRLRRGRWNLYRKHLPYPRAEHKVAAQHLSRFRLPQATWRRYYSARNLLVVAAVYSTRKRAFLIASTRLIGKPLLFLPMQPRVAFQHLRLGALAISHASRGKMGRTVEPTTTSGRLDSRGSETETPSWRA